MGTVDQKLQEINDGYSGNRSLTEESLPMCLVEQTLNARPITPASDGSASLEALTPSHFLLGRANVGIPFLSNAGVYSNHHKLFRSCQAYADMYWVEEYSPQNNARTQWTEQEANVEVGDLVWLVDINVKWCHYKMTRIQEIFPAEDGVVRSVLIKTHDGTFRRPVVKLAPLFNERFQSENGVAIVGASNEMQNNLAKK